MLNNLRHVKEKLTTLNK